MKAIDMTRHEGSKNVALVELGSNRQQMYIVRTDLKPYKTEEADGVTFIEHVFPYKPTMDKIKEFVHAVINAQTDEKILSGFVWNDNPVWLSAENQRNFSEAQRMANINAGILPVTFKLGENAEGEPVYHTFETVEDLNDFYSHAFAYINTCLSEGWQQKDGYDFSEYERQLGLL